MTQRNPLDQFRREPQQQQQPQTGTGAGAGLKPYAAFKAVDRKQERLDIRRLLGDSATPRYALLSDIRYKRDNPDRFVLVFTTYTATVSGKNLHEVRQAIAEGRCDFIQDFHPKEYMQPEPNAPVITSIVFFPEAVEEGNK